jgi:hypothetical protein
MCACVCALLHYKVLELMRSAIMKCHKLCGLQRIETFFTVLKAGSPRSRYCLILCLVRAASWFIGSTFAMFPPGGRGEGALFLLGY